MPRPGDRVGDRFRLEVRERAGGMGVVWRARDERSGAPVALKLLESADSVDLERFRREMKTLAALAHPAIVAYVGDGVVDDGSTFLAMEWIDGVTAGERLLGTGFSLAEAVALTRRVGEGLAAAHDAGIVHRDVKPSNVMLPNDSVASAKLIDFGVARVENASGALTRTGLAVGTPGYMAPEQARGSKRVGPPADVFALGCLLYECATGKPAFSGSLATAVLAKILVTHPPPLAADCAETPAALDVLLERMLAKKPEGRPRDAREVIEAIDAIGPIPRGPRRTAAELVVTPTVPARAAKKSETCVVMAARGELGDAHEGPAEAQLAAMRARLDGLGAALEVLRTGSVVVQLAGARAEVAARAADCAVAMRDELEGWSIVVSAVSAIDDEAGRTIDDMTSLLAATTISDLFAVGRGATIALDEGTASLLPGDFELEPGAPPKLRGRRRTTST